MRHPGLAQVSTKVRQFWIKRVTPIAKRSNNGSGRGQDRSVFVYCLTLFFACHAPNGSPEHTYFPKIWLITDSSLAVCR